MLTIGVDATPMLGRRTGIGSYVEHLLAALSRRGDVTVHATAFTARGGSALQSALPAGVQAHTRSAPARALRAIWGRAEVPPVSWFVGRTEVFHGTNFVLPPTWHAAGVLTIHDLAYLIHPEWVDATSRGLIDLVPRGIRRAGAVCTPTNAVAEQVREAYGPSIPELVVTPLGVDPRWLDATVPDAKERSRLCLPADYFLFVGTREPRKDLTTLAAAYADYRATAGSEAIDLLLVGPPGWGPDHPPQPGVTIRGYLPAIDMPSVVAGARALVMPSRYEGFGLPALEALGCGTAVIVTDIPALQEVTGGHAAVFPPGDVAALTTRLAAQPLASAQDRRLRRDYARQWTWAACAEATMLAYRAALEDST